MGFNRDLSPSKSQSATYEAYGNAEDMSKLVTMIDPDQTLFLSKMKDGPDAKGKSFEWTTEGLRPPQKNAHLEKEDFKSGPVGSMEGMSNVTQKFINSGWVTDDQIKVDKIFAEKNELAKQIRKATTEQARDLEYAIVHGGTKVTGTATIPAQTGGIPYFMSLQTLDATIDATTGVVTTTNQHHLQTGDFVYFIAKTMPGGVKQGLIYYVRLDPAAPDTKFTIYNNIDHAVEGIAGKNKIPSSAGAELKIVKNNIIDLNDSTDYNVEHINSALQMCYNRGGNPTDAIMSASKKLRFSQIVSAIGTTQRKSGERKMDTVVDVFASNFGTITAISHRMYNDDRIDFLDNKYWEKKWFNRPHQVTGLAKKGTYEEFVLSADFGIQGTQPKASGSIINISR